DLWSYNHKHNEQNGENNRDGDDNNHSWNCGVEGETTDATVNALRRRLTRSALATLFCSLGVPFLTMGDERWRTQGGNNNAYCQDNEVSWLHWESTAESASMLAFVKQLIDFRRAHPELRRRTYFSGVVDAATGYADVTWLNAKGEPMTHEQWHCGDCQFFAARICGAPALLLLFNASASPVTCTLPPGDWRVVFDTALEPSFVEGESAARSGAHEVAARSVVAALG
ncbi:MAG: glycogen debranching enzyme GlgX, partial [Roseimicrobium sp.]